MSDEISVRIRSWANHIAGPDEMLRTDGNRWYVVIGDAWYEFPVGTTREEAQSVLDEAKRRTKP